MGNANSGNRNLRIRAKYDEHREKIETTKLIKRLQTHALNKEIMSASQIDAAKTLLKKVLPDMKETEHHATVDGTLTIRIIDPTRP